MTIERHKLKAEEIDELRARARMIADAERRLGQIDRMMADLEAKRHQARMEAVQQENDCKMVAARALSMRGLEPSRWIVDIDQGFILPQGGAPAMPEPARRKKPTLKLVPKARAR